MNTLILRVSSVHHPLQINMPRGFGVWVLGGFGGFGFGFGGDLGGLGLVFWGEEFKLLLGKKKKKGKRKIYVEPSGITLLK